ncbi:MAG: hypothetical protein HRT45_17090 [Bdellovibrionales bacterium]|nr:hypothetical protein [Bdellovibrionales bacterium]
MLHFNEFMFRQFFRSTAFRVLMILGLGFGFGAESSAIVFPNCGNLLQYAAPSWPKFVTRSAARGLSGLSKGEFRSARMMLANSFIRGDLRFPQKEFGIYAYITTYMLRSGVSPYILMAYPSSEEVSRITNVANGVHSDFNVDFTVSNKMARGLFAQYSQEVLGKVGHVQRALAVTGHRGIVRVQKADVSGLDWWSFHDSRYAVHSAQEFDRAQSDEAKDYIREVGEFLFQLIQESERVEAFSDDSIQSTLGVRRVEYHFQTAVNEYLASQLIAEFPELAREVTEEELNYITGPRLYTRDSIARVLVSGLWKL